MHVNSQGRIMLRYIFIILIFSTAYAEDFKFAVIADCQYCDQPDRGARMYKSSLGRLKLCIDELNKHDIAFTVHLGDLIDKDFKSFKPVLNILKKSKSPVYHALGNHDFSVKDELKAEVPKTLNMPGKYYSFKVKKWRFIVIDGNDISFYAYPKNSAYTKLAEKYYKENKVKSPKWNGAVGPKQLEWLKQQLTDADKNNESVALFCHFPVFPKDPHNLWNDSEVLKLLSQHKSVKAYINGHNHKGNYDSKDGIHYLTAKGMVQFKTPTYAIISVTSSNLSIKGFGAEEDRKLKLK